jgi:tetratricopeptide (TPR) repeat protein
MKRPSSRILSLAVLVATGSALGAALVLAAPEEGFRNPPAPLSMAEEALGGADGPFFPSAARNSGRGLLDGRLLLDAEGCGRAGCHPAALVEWRASPHRYSGLENPWYRKSFEALRAAKGPVASRWCAGCHSPALLQSGQLDLLPAAAGAPRYGEPGPQAEPAIVQAGVTCTACHGIGRAGSTMGQGDYELDLPPLHDLATSREPFLQEIHDHLVRVDPPAHRRAYARPALASAELCSTCHKAHLDAPINGKRWFAELDDLTSWQANAISGEGARSFNFPARTQTCVDCHMPESAGQEALSGARLSHRFAAANTALPTLFGEREQLAAVERFLAARQVTVDIFALSKPPVAAPDQPPKAAPDQPAAAAPEHPAASSQPAAPEQPTVPDLPIALLDPVVATVRRGEARRLTVVVRTRGVGHLFPGGKRDLHDCWLELKGVDDRGRVVFWSGRADESSPVDPGAHLYRERWVDERGEVLTRRESWLVRGVAYRGSIGPDASEAVHYRLEVPPDAGDRITLTARLNYRKLAWDFTQWVFGGEGAAARQPPRMPIVVLAEDTTTLQVIAAAAPLPAAGEPQPGSASPADVERWHDYGVALALQGDWRAARPVLEAVTRLAPDHPDAWVNLARVELAEGDLARMEAALAQAVRLEPDSGRVHYYRGMLAVRAGESERALEHLRAAVARRPRDRALRRELAQQLLLQQDYAGAVQELESVLLVDAEDRAAHLSLTLAYRALGQAERAERHQKLAARFAPFEAGHILTPEFWAAHPHENLERQPVHEHRSAPLSEPPRGSGR